MIVLNRTNSAPQMISPLELLPDMPPNALHIVSGQYYGKDSRKSIDNLKGKNLDHLKDANTFCRSHRKHVWQTASNIDESIVISKSTLVTQPNEPIDFPGHSQQNKVFG